jgi:transcription elongation factor Elf1
MQTVNDNYPKGNTDLTDAQLKELALQNMNRDEVRNTGFPTEIISLPSQGKVYPAENPLSSGQIEMKYMTAREEDILTSPNLIKQGVVLDKLMQSLIVSNVKYDDIVIGDKNAIMIAARILGYGKHYNVELTCPSCNHKNKISVDLTTLEEKHLSEDLEQTSPGVFKFTLPNANREVEFKFLTSADEKAIQKELEFLKKTSSKDSINRELTTRLKRLIVSIDGNYDRNYISSFVQNELFAIDSRALRTYIKESGPDMKFTINFQCTECGHEEEALALPMGVSFFWPDA